MVLERYSPRMMDMIVSAANAMVDVSGEEALRDKVRRGGELTDEEYERYLSMREAEEKAKLRAQARA